MHTSAGSSPARMRSRSAAGSAWAPHSTWSTSARSPRAPAISVKRSPKNPWLTTTTRSPGDAWFTSAASMASVPEPAKQCTRASAEPTSRRIPAWMRSTVAAFSGPVWLRTGSARAASTSGATGVGPGIMSSGGLVMSRPMLAQDPRRRPSTRELHRRRPWAHHRPPPRAVARSIDGFESPDRVISTDRGWRSVAQRVHHGGVEIGPPTRNGWDWLRVTAANQAAPPLRRLEGEAGLVRSVAGSQGVFLSVEVVSDERCPITAPPEPRSFCRGESARPQGREDPRFVMERDKDVVIRPATARQDLRVDPVHRAEEEGRLVDQMGAEVEQDPPAHLSAAVLPPSARRSRAPALESGLVAEHLPEPVLGQEVGEGEVVGVPAPVEEWDQEHLQRRGVIDQGARRCGRRGKRFLDDDGDPGVDRGTGHRSM